MRKIFFKEDFQEQFIRKGYVTSPLLSDDEVAYILEEIRKLRPDDDFLQTDNGQFSIAVHSTIFDADVNYRRKANGLIREVFAPRIKQILVDYEIHSCNFFIKASNGNGYIGPHHHPPLIADTNDTVVTFWCPLVDADELNGTLQVVEGSHKVIPVIQFPCYAACYEDFTNKIFEKYMKEIPTKAGSCVAFDDTLVHGSQPNYSTSPRPAVQVSCVPSDAKTVFYFLDRNNLQKDFEVYEVGKDFFIERSVTDLVYHPPNLKRFGTVKNNYRKISEKEFAELLERGNEIRRKIYFPEEAMKSEEKVSLTKRIKSLFTSIVSQ